MAGKLQNLKFKQTIQAPLNEVFSAFSNAPGLSEWLCSVAQADMHKGGRYYLWWENGYYASGEFIELIPGDRIVFSWHGRGEPGESRVKVAFKPNDDGTTVTLIHQDLGSGNSWKAARRAIKRGWVMGLENLKTVIETGKDLRFSHRPIFGFTSLQALNGEEARQAGLPAKPGLLVLGVIEGMCAEKAGLRTGDFILKISGQKVASLHEFELLLNQHRAGNKIKVVYYRDGEKIQAKCELSQRPMPEIPENPEKLSQVLRNMYAGLNHQLDEILDSVGPDQLDLRSSTSNWSIRETLGHFIATEREVHSWIARMIEGQEADFALRSNQPVRIRATISAFPTLPSLRAELKRSQAETVAMVAELPSELLQRRRSYWRLALELLQTPPLHYQEHLLLMKNALMKSEMVKSDTFQTAEPPAEVTIPAEDRVERN